MKSGLILYMFYPVTEKVAAGKKTFKAAEKEKEEEEKKKRSFTDRRLYSFLRQWLAGWLMMMDMYIQTQLRSIRI